MKGYSTALLSVLGALSIALAASADETCQSPYLPKLEGQEDFVYVWTLGVEGLDEGHWVLIDANDVVIHVFDPETRENYDLERLWSDAPRVELDLPPPDDLQRSAN